MSRPKIQPLNKSFRRLWFHISKRRRKQFYLLFILLVMASFLEIVSIGSALPFLGALTTPEKVFNAVSAQPIIEAMGLNSPQQILLPLTLLFCTAALFAGVVRLLLLWISIRLSFAVGSDLSISIYQKTLYQPYTTHVLRNSSEVINGISGKANGVIYSGILPLLTIINSSVILISIVSVLIFINPVIAIFSTISFGLIYVLITYCTGSQKIKNSQHIARESTGN